jgi:hypothetical protein
MLIVDWEKLDKFYITLIVVLIIMACLVIFTFRGVFSSVLTAYELGPEELSNTELKVDTVKIDEAYNYINKRNVITLEIRE